MLKPKVNRKQDWFTEATQLPSLIAQRDSLTNLTFRNNNNSPQIRNQLRIARKNVRREVRNAKNDYVIKLCNTINRNCTAAGGTKPCWDAVKSLKKGFSNLSQSNQIYLRKADGSLCTTPEENASTFHAHFKNVYQHKPSFDPTVMNVIPQKTYAVAADTSPTDTEIKEAIKSLNNTAPGPSGIRSNIWKTLGEDSRTFQIIKAVILDFWHSEIPPKEWNVGRLTILPKKRDLKGTQNVIGASCS